MTRILDRTPLGRLLHAVSPAVADQYPIAVSLRELHRDMSGILKKLQIAGEYRVLTNRGAPWFLLIPIDETSWTSLLMAAPPQTSLAVASALYEERASGVGLPDTDAVVGDLRAARAEP
ncbi:MAG: hypothetical protein JWM66_736 [Solirubrobacterales bacterium]|nr:hypothetical protein [Solirubrobacterales bacterium]